MRHYQYEKLCQTGKWLWDRSPNVDVNSINGRWLSSILTLLVIVSWVHTLIPLQGFNSPYLDFVEFTYDGISFKVISFSVMGFPLNSFHYTRILSFHFNINILLLLEEFLSTLIPHRDEFTHGFLIDYCISYFTFRSGLYQYFFLYNIFGRSIFYILFTLVCIHSLYILFLKGIYLK